MNRHFGSIAVSFAVCAAIAYFLIAPDTYAAPAGKGAAAGGKKGGAVLVVKELPKLGKSALVRAPEIDGKIKAPSHRNTDARWAQFEVEYDTTPEWIDEATFNFSVMLQEPKSKQWHLFQTAVTYLDIAKGSHGAAVMLPPAAVARYGEIKFFHVEITIDGEAVAKKDVGAEGWVEQMDKLGDRVTRHSGYLQDRSKTPFGLTYIDDYEAVR